MIWTTPNLKKVVDNQVVVITGGSSGIGLATAKVVAAAGAKTILISRTKESLLAAKDEIVGQGGSVSTYQADISDIDVLPGLIEQIQDEHGSIDILINNAGRSIRRSIASTYDRFHDIERTMKLNYFGAVRLVLLVLPEMAKRRRGHIINISSIGVQANAPRFSAYVASKAALDAFTRCVASEFLEDSVRFTTVSMPLVKTPMTAPTKFSKRARLISPEKAAGLVTKAIVKKPAKISTIPGTLAQVAYFLFPNYMLGVASGSFRRARDSDRALGGEKAKNLRT